jgi:hypothetical protein
VWIFFTFWSSRIHVSPTNIVSSLFPPRWCLSSGRCCHDVMPCHASFPLSKDELAASASSSDNALSCRLASWSKIEELNSHHHRRLPSPDRLTPTLYCYKKIISTLVTLPTTKLHLHFASSLARAPHHRSSTRHHRSLSLLSHAHRPSTQWHPRWQTRWPSCFPNSLSACEFT